MSTHVRVFDVLYKDGRTRRQAARTAAEALHRAPAAGLPVQATPAEPCGAECGACVVPRHLLCQACLRFDALTQPEALRFEELTKPAVGPAQMVFGPIEKSEKSARQSNEHSFPCSKFPCLSCDRRSPGGVS